MTQGSSSVVVVPQDWEGGIDELARKMMPVTRQPPAQVVPLLERGPMTIEADLSPAEAARLQERLRALGVPARIVAFGEVIEVIEPIEPIATIEPPATPAPAAKKERLRAALARSSESAPTPDDALEIDGAFGAEPAPPELVAPPQPAAPLPGWDIIRAPEMPPQEDAFAHTTTLNIPPKFDALQMSGALRGEERPPYAPEGFDDRIEHIPALAALLSALAPGAGQIYNGQDDQVREICLQFALLRPWVESVRQARKRAEKIRDYWAPWPQKGALGRALKHLAICWVVAALLFGALAWAGTAIYRVVSAPPVPTIARVDAAKVMQRAQKDVRDAWEKARAVQDSQAQAEAERAGAERFTMPDAERAERLFRQGYAYCTAGRYRTCAASMRRVSELSPELRRKAFRLQAWAEIRQSSDRDAPMPDVGEVESLSEYEMMMLPSQPK